MERRASEGRNKLESIFLFNATLLAGFSRLRGKGEELGAFLLRGVGFLGDTTVHSLEYLEALPSLYSVFSFLLPTSLTPSILHISMFILLIIYRFCTASELMWGSK